jgi:cytochrome P450
VVPLSTYRINNEEDVVLKSGFVIPRRTAVFVYSMGIHFNSLAFEDPHKCGPRRHMFLFICSAAVVLF